MTENAARQITDNTTLAALAHPLRRRIMDLLRVHGPATASTLAQQTEQAVANVSHHLRVLGGSNLIVPAPDLARDKRERWWRIADSGLRWSSRDFDQDPAGALIARSLMAMSFDHQVAMTRAWLAEDGESSEWADSSFSTDKWLRLTPAELTELSVQLNDLLHSWANREIPDDGQDREPVYVFGHGFPAQP